MPSVYIKTYGCQMNERDSEAVAAQLAAKGYTLAPSEASADVILLNTCSVRDAAETKALGKMRSLAAETRRFRPNVILGFMGCMAQSRGRQLIDQLPTVQLVLGTQKFHRAGEHLDALLAGKTHHVVDIEAEPGSQSAIREHLTEEASARRRVTAYVSIMQGCNQHCTFCIVPHTRGQERSRAIDDIVSECRDLVARGVKEITLLGQIVTSYGRRDIGIKDGKSPFVQLIEAVHGIAGLERIRFTSPHPKGYGDDLVEAYSRLPKLVESAHLPAQSGSDRVLRAMHRGYTRQRYMEIVCNLRRAHPRMSVSTDLIVGFPGETDADFEETLDLAREAQFDNAFIFKYSPRTGTPAAALPDQLPKETKEERNSRLLTLVNEISLQRYSNVVGQQVQILVEGPSRKKPFRMMGRTRNNRIVVFDGAERHRGQLMDVSITRAGAFTLYGDPAILNMDQ